MRLLTYYLFFISVKVYNCALEYDVSVILNERDGQNIMGEVNNFYRNPELSTLTKVSCGEWEW